MPGTEQIIGGILYYYGTNDFDNYSVGSTDMNAILLGYNGLNFLRGGQGDDIIVGGRDTDHLHGNEGDDLLFGGNGADFLDGGAGQDKLYGGDGNDTLTGSDGWDQIYGGSGSDTFQASTAHGVGWSIDLASGFGTKITGTPFGLDIINGNPPSMIYAVAELESIENVTGSYDDDQIFGNDADNILKDAQFRNSRGDDVIEGRGGNDVIQIGGGSDIVDGGTGNDTIEVLGGYDHVLTGGAGRDTFDFKNHVGAPGHIGRIEDFNIFEGDQVRLLLGLQYDTNPDDDIRPGSSSYWVDQIGNIATLNLDFANDGVVDRSVDIVMAFGATFMPEYDVIA